MHHFLLQCENIILYSVCIHGRTLVSSWPDFLHEACFNNFYQFLYAEIYGNDRRSSSRVTCFLIWPLYIYIYIYIYIYLFNHLKMSRITLTFSWTRYVAILLPERCRVWDGSRALIHQADGCLTSRSRKVSKPRDCILKWSNHSDIWHASWQCYYRGAFQISVRLEKSEPESCGIETSRDLTIRRPSA